MQDILQYKNQHKSLKIIIFFTSIYIGLLMLLNINDIDIDRVLALDPYLLLLSQGVSFLVFFIFIPILFLRYYLKLKTTCFFPSCDFQVFFWILGITLLFMIMMSCVGEWNQQVIFSKSDWFNWMKEAEKDRRLLTIHLTNFSSFTHFILVLIVMALLPAIGEELVFRGIVQNVLYKAKRNPHLAIWVTGIIFSAIHFQFFGFFPRLFLGVFFGYLYWWSGKLTFSMMGHFVNNGLALCFMYYAQTQKIPLEETQKSAPAIMIFISVVLFVILLTLFRKKYISNESVGSGI